MDILKESSKIGMKLQSKYRPPMGCTWSAIVKIVIDELEEMGYVVDKQYPRYE